MISQFGKFKMSITLQRATAHESSDGLPIHFMFCSRIGLSGSADRTAPREKAASRPTV